MQPSRFQRFLPVAGVLFAVLFIVALALSPNEPSDTASVAKTFSYFKDHQNTELVSTLMVHTMSVLIVFFAAGLRSALRAGDGDRDGYGTLVLAGGVLTAAGFTVDAMLSGALVSAADHGSSSAVYTLNQLYGFDWVGFTAGMSVLLLAAGIGGLATRALPKPLSWVAIVMGAAALTPAGIIAFFLMPLWTLAASIVLWRRLGSSRAGAPVAAAGMA